MSTPGQDYLRWFHETNVWKAMGWRGVRTLKLPSDMWNYQEIISERSVQWVVETGTRHGGSALYFADLLAAMGTEGAVITVDVTHEALHPSILGNPRIQLLLGDSGGPEIAAQIAMLLPEERGTVFMILDSDHAAAHVHRELTTLVPLLRRGDYLVVEDTIVNGHPVRPAHGPGPWEALDRYLAENPNVLAADMKRENKFGCTFAARGYFVKL
ncbi:CmcI family methyltransferase [Azospirillum sp. ST 5-10]|uniref:CmcI family methyltransferase n=1 Tax=unclassified Azospirillum TaxID=2630922 RepID=UPI003F4A336F